MDTARYILGVLDVVVLPPSMAYWIVIHPFAPFWRGVGVVKTYAVVATMMVVLGVGLYVVRDVVMGRPLETHWTLWVLAGLLVIGSRVVETWCRRQLVFRTLAGVPELHADQDGRVLLDEGSYAVVRHPRYVAVALGMLAYAVFVHYVGLYIFTAVSCLALGWVAWLEERELERSFGSRYREYRRRVPMFIPRVDRARTEGR